MAPRRSHTSPNQVSPIPLPYRLFFLYLDPLVCLSAIYLSFFDPASFILNGVPSALKPVAYTSKGRKVDIAMATAIDPMVKHFVRSVGAYSIGILVLQVGLGWGFKDTKGGLNIRIWRILHLSILAIDLSLLYSVYIANPAAFLDVKSWDQGDWTNNGVLGFVALMRSAFLLGVGF